MNPKQLRSLNEAVRQVQLKEFRLKNGEPDMAGDHYDDVAEKHKYNKVNDNQYMHTDNHGAITVLPDGTWAHTDLTKKVGHRITGTDTEDLDKHLTDFHK